MPKKIIYDEPEEDEDEEEVEDDDDEEYLEDIVPKKTGKPKFNLPKSKAKEKPKEIKEKMELESPKRRYVAFSTPQRVGIMDAETNEVIAEGEFALLQSNADILERLERIENLIGATME